MYNLDPTPTQTLDEEAQVHAFANPTRMTILTMLAQEKQSVSGVARQLGVHPANLTHHFKLLEKAGLIRLVEKRETGKNLEKLYRATAYHYIIGAGGHTTNKRLLALAFLRDHLTTALQRLPNLPAELPVLGLLKTVRLKPEDLAAFQQKLLALAEDFEAQTAESGEVYSLNLSLYPDQAQPIPPQKLHLHADEA